ncbi:hypothetical protein L1987_57449 [Smallanthus sonchifolius]|uniref:Uncharacterized protein n=1 Tax=Smallanthus sonchifolius TaxID=185202 RepID=A0ACB9DD49_9ASTR|nr:hypothetical protein L1987_57449 [Smallanthus sonchifolius]
MKGLSHITCLMQRALNTWEERDATALRVKRRLGKANSFCMSKMHKVDEEALPLLSMDGLKEMYALAVCARRNPYAAVCRLRGK